ncbi:ditrans,polycis-polyprenyl diphosphate synthase [Salvia divinorum]
MSLQFATVAHASRFSPPPKHSFHSIKGRSTAGKRTVGMPNAGGFSSPPRAMPKACLAGAAASADAVENAVEEAMMPKHVAIIMDGNGKWAKDRKLAAGDGHRAGWKNLTTLISKCCELRIETLTIFAFSNDSKRSQMEEDLMMRSTENYIRTDVKELITRHGILFSMIGNKSRLPVSLQSSISWAEETSKGNKGMNLVMAANYSGRDDVVQATKKISSKVERGVLRAADIDQTMFEQELMTNTLESPNPDLLIRTNGELGISGFLLWQLAYTEFYFVDKLFPDFGEDDLRQALASYGCRQRRYGQRKN